MAKGREEKESSGERELENQDVESSSKSPNLMMLSAIVDGINLSTSLEGSISFSRISSTDIPEAFWMAQSASILLASLVITTLMLLFAEATKRAVA